MIASKSYLSVTRDVVKLATAINEDSDWRVSVTEESPMILVH